MAIERRMETGILKPGGSGRLRGCLVLAVALVSGVLFAPVVAQSAEGVDEYRAKAAFLYNFSKFVIWPEIVAKDDERPFVIGVVENAPMAAVLTKELAGKQIGGRYVVVREVRDLRNAEGCEVAYCTSAQLKALPESRRIRLERAGLMTVGDCRAFLDAGGVLALELVEDRLAFEINVGASRRSGLQMSAKLLGLALSVVDR